MTTVDWAGQTLQRLQDVLATAPLSEQLLSSGRALARRLSSPVRVTFVGPPKSGKSTLINALTGQTVIPDSADLPSYEIWYAETPHVVVTKGDGSTEKLGQSEFGRLAEFAPVFLQFYLPQEIFKRMRVLEIVTDGSPAEMAAATRWAAKRTDIAIWCSREFEDIERGYWSLFPDEQKDHGFLVLTQADRLSPELISARLDQICDEVVNEFRIIAPVAAKQAFPSQNSKPSDKDQMMKSSGLRALRSELLRHIELGRQADIDHASVFLNRFEKTTPRKVINQKGGAEKPSKILEYKDNKNPEDNAAPCQSYSAGTEYLRSQAIEMFTDIEEFGSFASKKIVERCLETANTLVDMVADEYPETDHQELAVDAATEAADVLLLMTLENTRGAAEDAVNLLLQVKRDFEVAAAA